MLTYPGGAMAKAETGSLKNRIVVLVVGAVASIFASFGLDALLRGASALALPPLAHIPYVVAFWLLLVAAIFSCLSWLKNDLRSGAFDIEYISLQDDDWSALFRASQQIIKNAKHQILAINSWMEEQPLEKNGPDQAARQKYFDALMKASERVDYRRLVQIDEGIPFAKAYPDAYVNHFRVMFEASVRRQELLPGEAQRQGASTPSFWPASLGRFAATPRSDSKPPKIELLAVMPRFPETFLLVDDEWLIWQLNRVDSVRDMNEEIEKQHPSLIPKHLRFRMRAVIRVHDPSRLALRHFQQAFEEAEMGRYRVGNSRDLRWMLGLPAV